MPPIVISAPRVIWDSHLWVVLVAGIDHIHFQKATGLSVEIAEIEYNEGGRLTSMKSPGKATYSNVTLERGKSTDHDLWEWMEEVIDITQGGPGQGVGQGLPDPDFRRDLDIVQLSRTQEPILGYRMLRAWPKSYKPGEWDAEADSKVIESVEIVHEGLVKLSFAI